MYWKIIMKFYRIRFRVLQSLQTLNPLLGILFLSILVSSCSTKKNTFTRRAYHNLVAHYNTYWNGRESFKEGVRTLEQNAKDNYTTVLPVFKFGTEQEAITIASNMDRAIEKASKVILKHSMYFKKKEHVRRVMDSYLLIGKAYLYKKDYPAAKRAFEFISSYYPNEPIKFEADLWLAITYIQNGEFEKSSLILDKFNKDLRTGKAPEKFDRLYQMIYAHHYILQQNYQPAIKHLQRSIELNRNKNIRNRLRFILAQIYQELGNVRESARYYQLVISKNPPYEMAINAKINLAKTYNSRRSQRNYIVKNLEKLLKDQKNTEYLDQIHYALAEIYEQDNQPAKVIDHLRLSVATSVSNDYQKAKSSLKLAEIYFQQPNYILAQAYYDTAMQVMPPTYPNYSAIKSRTGILTDLITNLNNIAVQDSLQRIAKMSESERNKIIDEIIRKISEEEMKKAEMESEAMRTASMLEQTQRFENRSMQQSGGWYFYNPTALSMGYTEFINKWGRRKLEDLWRLSNKQVTLEMDEPTAQNQSETEKESEGKEKTETDPKKREYYLQYLPLTPEALEKSNKIIEGSLFKAAYIYKDGLKNNQKSIETFEELLRRFPEFENRLMVYYQLYKNYEEVPDLAKSDYYKNLIVKEYPDTDYAKIILDPNYNLVVMARLNAAENLYHDTYNAFLNQQYYLVINNANTAQEKYPESKLIPKFEFLKALSYGRLQDNTTMRNILENIVSNYPESEIKQLAAEILGKIRVDESGNLVVLDTPVNPVPNQTASGTSSKTTSGSLYKTNPSAVHFFVIIADETSTNINALKVRLSDFNTNYFKLSQLNINSLVFSNNYQMITVGNFENAEKAMVYYRSVSSNPYISSPLEGTGAMMFVINAENYPVFYRDKDIQKYLQFFENVYLK